MDLKLQVPLDPRDVFVQLDLFKHVPWMEYRLFGNELSEYLLAFISFVVLWGGFRGTRWLFLKKLRHADTVAGAPSEARSIAQELGAGVWSLTFWLAAFSIAISRLDLSAPIAKTIEVLTVSVLTAQLVTLANIVLERYIWRIRLNGREANQSLRASTQNIVTMLKLVVWIAGILFVLDNIGINISTFVAGLGIGGVAIALAAQAVLGDTFSSFAIAMDKPFEVGDFISIEGFNGTVEHVGFKTTRVRALSGELLVFSNSDMTKSRIRNFRKMRERRVHFRIGVVYQTTVAQMREIPQLIKAAIDATPKCRFDRSNFLEFADSSLIIDTVFWVEDPEYIAYAEAHQAINLRIMESFTSHGIEFAYPTRTLHVAAAGSLDSTLLPQPALDPRGIS